MTTLLVHALGSAAVGPNCFHSCHSVGGKVDNMHQISFDSTLNVSHKADVDLQQQDVTPIAIHKSVKSFAQVLADSCDKICDIPRSASSPVY